jgi:hypothetical protein
LLIRSRIRKQPATRSFYRLSGLPEIGNHPRSGQLAQPPETKGATRLEAEVGMQLPACRKSENTAKRETGTAAGDERSDATGGGGGNAAFGLPKIRNHPRSGQLAQPPETKGATRLEAEVGMRLPACRKSETIREAAHWHSHRRRKEQRDWRRRWECSFRLAENQKPSAKRLTGTATGDETSNATGGGGGNAASGLPEIGKHREAGNWHSRRRRKERRDWRRRWESNPRMTVLQTIALPLGYSAVRVARERFGSGGAGLCQRGIREIA